MLMKFLIQFFITSIYFLTLSSCSLNSFTNHVPLFFIDHSIRSLNTENDLLKVENQLPENIALLEKIINFDKNNKNLHIYAAQAYYSYSFAFIEDRDTDHASSLYYQSYQHASTVLALHGISTKDLQGSLPQLKQKTRSLNKDAINALYWTAISWAKIIEINQPNLLLLTQLHKAVLLMEQVIKLDATYHFGGPYMFFAVYYGGRPDYLGGNNHLAKKYFELARNINNNRLLLVDYLQAKYLDERISGKKILIKNLQYIINAPDDLYPEQALMNAVIKQKALRLLEIQ